jgi:Tol biopolymer transport system component
MRCMKRSRLLLLLVLVGLILVPAAGISYMLLTPRLAEVSPLPDAANLPADTALVLTFNRPMVHQTVLDRLVIFPPVQGNAIWEGRKLTFKPADAWPSGATITVELRAGAKSSGKVSFPVRDTASWSFTIGQPQLVYLSPADGPSNLYLLNPFSGEIRQLTDSQSGIVDFDVVEGGNAVFYSVSTPAGSSDIYQIEGIQPPPAQAGELPAARLVVECPQARCHAPHVSPQGDFLAYEQTSFTGQLDPAFPQVWLLPLEDGKARPGDKPALAGDPEHQTLQPQWSPDGDLTFYDTNQSAFIVLNPRSGESSSFPNQTGYPGSWNPQGAVYAAPEISFPSGVVQQNAPVGISHLIAYRRADQSATDLSQDEVVEDAFPSFARDGTSLAFARRYMDTNRWTPGRQLWLMNADGSNPHQLTDEPLYNHFDFAWSPDSQQLVFVRFNQTELTEPPEIWMMDPNTGAARRLLVGGYAPQWIP